MKERIKYIRTPIPEEWINTYGNRASVMVCDTMVDLCHPAIKDNIVAFANFLHPNKQIVKSPHGTHVCGIIAGCENKHIGIAPMSSLIVSQCMTTGIGTIGALYDALEWCIELKPDVLNLSVAYPKRNKKIERALIKINENNTIICAAQTKYPDKYPSCYDYVISVGGYNSIVKRGPDINARCPEKIISSFPNGEYRELSGHSMSCAYMSGVCALAKAYNKNITTKSVINEIKKRSKQIQAVDDCYNVRIFSDI